MKGDLIIIDEYCINCNVESSFLISLNEMGLIVLENIDGEHYLHSSEINKIEKFSRMYYDLSINLEGIDTVNNLLDTIEILQAEVRELREKISLFEKDMEGLW